MDNRSAHELNAQVQRLLDELDPARAGRRAAYSKGGARPGAVRARRGPVPQAPITSCRDRQRQLLDFVDRSGQVPWHDLLEQVGRVECRVSSHQLLINEVQALFDASHDGGMVLSEPGRDWLDAQGRPAADWAARVPRGTPDLRPWQIEALGAWVEHGRHGVVEAVTGAGKSRVGIEAAREALAHDFSVVVCVPTVELVDQWHRAIRATGIRSVGKLGAGSRTGFETNRVVVGTIQSLYKKPPHRPDGKVLLVADECHRYGSREWSAILRSDYQRRLGLTATYERNDDGIRDLLRYFGGTPVFEIGFGRAIEDGVVAPYDVKLVGVELDASERADYDEADEIAKDRRHVLLDHGVPAEPFGEFMQTVSEIADDPSDFLNATAREYLRAFSKRIDVLSRARGKIQAARMLGRMIDSSHGALIFTRRIEACHAIAEALVGEGVKALPIHSELTRPERVERLIALKSGRAKALVAPSILDEGIDVPEVDLGVVMGGSKSRRQMIQRMGRVLRRKKDGRTATFVVVYAVGTTEDVHETDGSEGCLDLIMGTAASTEDWTLGDLRNCASAQ